MKNLTSSEPNSKKFPVGMIIILCFQGFGIFSSLLSFMSFYFLIEDPAFFIGSLIIKGIAFIIYSVASVAFGIALFTGILLRKKWAYFLTIFWYIFGAILSTINLLYAYIAPEKTLLLYEQHVSFGTVQSISMIQQSLLFSTIFGWLIISLIIFYLLNNKDFFRH